LVTTTEFGCRGLNLNPLTDLVLSGCRNDESAL
jgi:hypothetical protein